MTNNGAGGEALEFHHPDRLGTRLVTNNAANTSFEQSTLPFGTAMPSESTGFSNQVFTSYDRSPIAGLDYAVNRTYSPGQGRFTTVDPIGMASTSPFDPQSLNLYSYVRNNPIDFIDPSGLDDCPEGTDARPDATGTIQCVGAGAYKVDAQNSDDEVEAPEGTVGGVGISEQIQIEDTPETDDLDDPVIFDKTFTAILDAFTVLRQDRNCAKFFGLLDARGKFSEKKFNEFTKDIRFDAKVKTGGHTAQTIGKNITLNGGFFQDGRFRVSPQPFSLKNPRQGRAQTILHELGHVKGVLLSGDAGGLPNDPNTRGNQNEKKILDNCGKGLSQLPQS